MQSQSDLFMPLFAGSHCPQLNADTVLALFKVRQWSPDGSNDWEDEEAVVFNWENFVREAEGMSLTRFSGTFISLCIGGRHTFDDNENIADLPLILSFATGADCIPPLGFSKEIEILFGKDKTRLLPVVSTCALTLTLSLGLAEYDLFQKNMDLALLNAFEFGQV